MLCAACSTAKVNTIVQTNTVTVLPPESLLRLTAKPIVPVKTNRDLVAKAQAMESYGDKGQATIIGIIEWRKEAAKKQAEEKLQAIANK